MAKPRALVGAWAVPDFLWGPMRHVAGALRDRGDEPAARLCAQLLGNVLAYQVGLDDPGRHHGLLHVLVLPVYPLHAGDFDFRNPTSAAAGQGEGIKSEPIYEAMAEFVNQPVLLHPAISSY